MNEYHFDVKMFAVVTVMAETQAEARVLIDAVGTGHANLGSWPDGSPILADVTTDGEAYLLGQDSPD